MSSQRKADSVFREGQKVFAGKARMSFQRKQEYVLIWAQKVFSKKTGKFFQRKPECLLIKGQKVSFTEDEEVFFVEGLRLRKP